jgi:L-methionine (R)-S-oxide reductase
MDKEEIFKTLRKRVGVVIGSKLRRDEKLKAICKLLKNHVSYYNFVGFYIVDNSQNWLVLGPFEGEPTEHIKIPFGVGICGQAAMQKKTFVVQNVAEESNYLSCNADVKAEIVIPIFKEDKIVGELDIDSNTISPFTNEDKIFLEKMSKRLSKLF